MSRDKLGRFKKGIIPYNKNKNIAGDNKICACCKEEKSYGKFGLSKSRPDGYNVYCKNCCKIKREKFKDYHKKYIKEYYAENKNELAKSNRARYYKNIDRNRKVQKEYYNNNKNKIAEINKEWADNNREKSNKIKADWKKRNPGETHYHCVLRRMRLKNQVPENVDLEAIKLFYKNCPKGMEVDHIIPVSKGGLHCVENFQYLTPTENRRKYNKLN